MGCCTFSFKMSSLLSFDFLNILKIALAISPCNTLYKPAEVTVVLYLLYELYK